MWKQQIWFFLLVKEVHFLKKWFFDLFASLGNMFKLQNFTLEYLVGVRSSHERCSIKKLLLKILRYSQERPVLVRFF